MLFLRTDGFKMKYFINIFLLLFFVISLTAQQNTQQNQIQTQSNLAIQYYNARDYEKAVPSLWNVYELTKNSAYFRYYLDCLIQLKRIDEAIRQIQDEIKSQKPAKPEFYIHWGYLLKMQSKYR